MLEFELSAATIMFFLLSYPYNQNLVTARTLFIVTRARDNFSIIVDVVDVVDVVVGVNFEKPAPEL